MKILLLFPIFLFGLLFSFPPSYPFGPTPEQAADWVSESSIFEKHNAKLLDIIDACKAAANTPYQLCINFLAKMNEKTSELFNETKTDIEKILYG